MVVPLRDGRGRALARRRAGLVLGLVLALAAALSLAPRAGAVEVVYAPAPGANAVHDAGVTGALRQGPIFDDRRWPRSRQLAKVSGHGLSQQTVEQMVATLTRALNDQQYGGWVGVDEILPGHWDSQSWLRLRLAMERLGRRAENVVFYVGSAGLERVGRAGLAEEPLPGELRGMISALSAGGHTFLEVYRGSLAPVPLREMAVSLTRWWERWPDARGDFLHVLIGPSVTTSQADIWHRVRSTPAGRRILRNGPGAFGLQDRQQGLDWAAQYRAFQAAPDAPPPGGDFPVPQGDGLVTSLESGSTLAPGATFEVTIDRAGRIVVILDPASGPRRVIRAVSVSGPATRTIRLPRDLRPGQYTVRVNFNDAGVGVDERLGRAITIRRPSSSPGPGRPAGLAPQLLINQRISQAAVRRLNAIQDWIDAGLTTGDLAASTFGTDRFHPSVVVVGGPGAPGEPPAPRPLEVPGGSGGGSAGDVRATPAQLLINQRISQAAVLRANGLQERLGGGLTGGDIVDGSLTAGKIAAGLTVARTSPVERPPPSRTDVRPPTRNPSARLSLSRAQLVVNQRISQAAVRRANELREAIESGLGAENFRPLSITPHALEPGLR